MGTTSVSYDNEKVVIYSLPEVQNRILITRYNPVSYFGYLYDIIKMSKQIMIIIIIK